MLLHSHASLTGISSGKSDRVDEERSGLALGDNPLQTEHGMVGIALLFSHPFLSSCGNKAHELRGKGGSPQTFAVRNRLL